MLKRYQLVVFDWEGTLAEDSLGTILSVLAIAAERMHLGPLDLPLARRSVVLGLTAAVKKLFPNAQQHQQEALCGEVQKALTLAGSSVHLVPGALETVGWLHTIGMHLAIATNKSQQGLVRVLQLSGLDQYFKVTRAAGQVPPKPCPQMLDEIMTTFGVTPEQTLMVGDSVSDMEMAASLGVDAIGMDVSQAGDEALQRAGACHVFHHYQQLVQYIKDN